MPYTRDIPQVPVTVTIRVVEANGWPVQGALVTSLNPSISLRTDANGMVTFKSTTIPSQYGGDPHWFKANAYGFEEAPFAIAFASAPHADVIMKRDDTKYFAGWTQLRNAETKEALSGAMVYIGDRACGPADANGRVWVSGPLGQVTVRVVKAGEPKIDDTKQITTVVDIGFPTVYDVGAIFTPAASLTFKTAQQKDICITFLKQDGTFLDQGMTDANGVVKLASSHKPGNYKVTASKDGYTSVDTPLAVSHEVTEYAVQPPVLQGDGSQEGTADAKDTKSGEDDAPGNGTSQVAVADRPLAITEPSDQYDYEWIFPNSVDGKYFTTTQARMYIGNLFIDELNTVQFAYQGNRIPLYGYASEDMDAVGSGKRLVQGQILINFISEGYLYTVLNEHKRILQDAKAKIAKQQNDFEEAKERLAQLQQRREQILQDVNRVPVRLEYGGSGEASDYQAEELDRIDEEISRLAAIHGPEVVDAAKLVLAARDRLKANANPITLKIPFDIVLELEGGGRTVTRKLENCVLTSNEQIYDQSGATLLDAYGFIARRLI